MIYKAITVIFFFFVSFNLFSQNCIGGSSSGNLPTKCFEIESILADACSSVEGEDEMIRLRIGPNAIALNSINSIIWQTVNSWLGFANITGATLTKINNINSSIAATGNCGRFIPVSPGGTIPAYAKVLFITSTDFSTTAHSFTGLTDTMYVIMQIAGNTGGHFTNSGNVNRTFIMRAGTCGDTVNWNSANLIGGNGAAVDFTFSGVPTYVNNGCAIPSQTFNVDAGIANPSYCNGSTVPLAGAVSGTNCYVWRAIDTATGNFIDSTNLLTLFTIKPGYVGAVKLYLFAKSNCTIKRDSIMFNAIASSGVLNAGRDTALCNSVSFQPNASTTATGTLAWTEDGAGSLSASNILNPIYTPTLLDIGIVNLFLTQTTSCGILRDTVRINYSNKANPNFTLSDSLFCYNNVPININLSPTVVGGVFSSNIGSITGNVHTFNAVGNFVIMYKIGTGNCADSLSKPVIVYSQVNPGFTIADTLVCKDEPLVALNPTQSGGVFSGIRVSANYFNPDTVGVFQIKYKLANGTCKDSLTKTIEVKAKPNANFTFYKNNFCLNDSAVTLLPIQKGGVFSGINVLGNKFTPNSVGLFTIKYLISNSTCADSTFETFTVYARPNAAFTLSDTLVCIGSPNISLTPNQAGGVFSGTNVTGSLFSPINTGLFPIKYIISNSYCVDSTINNITVLPKPDASFTTSDSIFCLNDPIGVFTPLQVGGNFIGNYVTANTFSPNSVGSFIVKHLVVNGSCADSSFKTMQVNSKPTANFSFSPTNGLVGDTILFTYTGNGATSYLWQFGDNNKTTSTLKDPFILYNSDKVYNVWLKVINNDGCEDSIQKNVTIKEKENLFVPNVFTPQGDGINDYFSTISYGIEKINMKIFNRWGGLIFETNNISQGWDGTYNGNACSIGVYFYIIEAVSFSKKEYNIHGTVTLLR